MEEAHMDISEDNDKNMTSEQQQQQHNAIDTSPSIPAPIQPPPRPRYTRYNTAVAVVLGIILIVCGIVAVVLQSYAMYLQPLRERDVPNFGIYYFYNPYFHNGSGIWCGIVFVICGSVTITSIKRSRVTIISTLVTNIITCIFCVLFIVYSGYAARFERSQNYGFSYYTWFHDAKNYLDRRSTTLATILCIDGAVTFITIVACVVMASVAISDTPRDMTRTGNLRHTHVQQTTGYPQQQTSYPQQQIGYPQQQTGYPQQQPGYAQQPIGYPLQPTAYPQQHGGNLQQPAGQEINPTAPPSYEDCIVTEKL